MASQQPGESQQSDPASKGRGVRSFEDPLLIALMYLARYEGINTSEAVLTGGLPLVEGKLTPELFVRAAARASMDAEVVQRKLSDIHSLLLPVTLLVDEDSALVLLSLDEASDRARVFDTQSQSESEISLAELQARYSGFALYTKPAEAHENPAETNTQGHRWFWQILGRSWKIYRDVLVASLFINLFVLANPLFVMNVYDRVVPNSAIETLWALAIGILILFCFDFALKMLRTYFLELAGKKSDVLLSSFIFEKVLGAHYAEHPRSVGAFVANLREFETVRQFITSTTVTALIDLPFVLLFLAVLFYIGGSVAWVPVFLVPLVLLFSWFSHLRLSRYVAQTFDASARKNAAIVETLTQLETVKTLNGEGRTRRHWESAVGQLSRWSLSSRMTAGSATQFATFLQQVGSVLVVIVGVYAIANRELTQGALIASVILSARVMAPFAQVASLMVQFHQSRLALDSLQSIVSKPQEMPAGRRFIQSPVLRGGLEFRDVGFRYPDESAPVLRGVSLTVRPGERVAIIGRIGSGKSTLQKLILGLYQPSSGNVLFDGVDMEQYSRFDLRAQCASVAQDTQLFTGSIRENILMGAAHVSDADMLRAADISGVSNWINNHPDGYERHVGERGELLSGGQKQSLALARALVSSKPILLLDEPTAAMDNTSEAHFLSRFQAYLADSSSTLVLITHKISLLALVDRIVVLDRGKIVADGEKQAVLDALKKGQLSVSS